METTILICMLGLGIAGVLGGFIGLIISVKGYGWYYYDATHKMRDYGRTFMILSIPIILIAAAIIGLKG